MTNTAEKLDLLTTNVTKLYDILKSGQAPAHVGKPVWAKDFDMAKAVGGANMALVLGHKDTGHDLASRPLNFGSKASTGMLPEETRLRLFAFKKAFNNCEIIACAMNRQCGGQPTLDMLKATPTWKEFEAMAKAFDVTDFANWIPTVNARFYFEEFEIQMMLASLFDQLPMESATVQVPGARGLPEGKEEADINTFDQQSNTTDGYTVYARNNVYFQQITEDLTQDAAPAIIQKLRTEGARACARAYERALINGDTAGTPRGSAHQDSDTAAIAKHFSKAFDGLRKKALANSANGVVVDNHGDLLGKSTFVQLLKAMGQHGIEKDLCRWVIGVSNSHDLVTGAIPELFTAFAFGGLASNVTGEMPPVFGIKPVVSRFVREDLAATGVYTGSGAPTTTLSLVKVDRFNNYVRAAMRQWATPSLANTDQLLMATKVRHAWNGVNQDANEKSVAIAINIGLS